MGMERVAGYMLKMQKRASHQLPKIAWEASKEDHFLLRSSGVYFVLFFSSTKMEGNASDSLSTFGSKHTDNGSFSNSEDFSPAASDYQPDVIYEGLVYHMGVNRLGYQFCHPRFLRIRGTFVEMYKKEPTRGHRPIRQGVAGQFLKIDDLGRRRFENEDFYVLKISNALDGTTKGEIACKTASDALKWKDAFLQAKEEATALFQKGSGRTPQKADQFSLSGHRPRLRRYARDLTKLIKIGKEDSLGRESSQALGVEFKKGGDDIIDQQNWRCVRSVNGIRILEDVSSQNTSKEKHVILKSVGVIAASPSAVFEMLIDVQNPHRKEWDVLTGDLKLVEVVDGHCDIVYGCFDPKYLSRWNSKRDFLFSRFWRHDPDNAYAIFQSSTSHKDWPKKRGYRRIKLNTTSWEIKPLPFNRPNSSMSVVTQTMEIRSTGWGRWRKKYFAKLDKTMPYVVLCQVAGLRDYFAANPVPDYNVALEPTVRKSDTLGTFREANAAEDAMQEEFYDAIAADVEEEDSEESDEELSKFEKVKSHRFKNIAMGISAFTLPAKSLENEVVSDSSSMEMVLSDFKGSLYPSSGIKDSNCWSDPGGREFMVRGKTYLNDYSKVSGGEPLLKLLAVDWFQSENRIDAIASNKNSLVQSEAAKKLPFLLVMNLQVPATPNYSLVAYFGASKEIRKGSLLDRFVSGSDTYRDSRFKLIPRIVEFTTEQTLLQSWCCTTGRDHGSSLLSCFQGYWFVKRAVGTKACLLGKAVTCRYTREGNFLEIDVDIGSSSVARSIINLVLGHVTSLVVDMAVLIEGREESELPEYLLGTIRINRVELQSAKSYK
ncbi:hypothetical protein L7F22_015479 [Adiantum nelumboides]|nr:hypothetical protein [Adiantum nelumboides]